MSDTDPWLAQDFKFPTIEDVALEDKDDSYFDDLSRTAQGLDKLLHDRLDAASVVEVLSDRNSKYLTRETEPNGTEFVRRLYTKEGQDIVTMASLDYYDFESAWKTMQSILEEAELPMVRSVLVDKDHDSALIVSDYEADAQPVIMASTEMKKIFAERLAKCFVATTSGRLALPVLNADGFAVTGSAEDKEITLIDVDPYIQHPIHGLRVPDYDIKRLCELFWDHWCSEDERTEVIRILLQTIVKHLTDEQMDEDGILKVISDASMMAQGIDPRNRNHPN